MPRYAFRPSSSAPVAAQVIGEELERIRIADDGKLTPPAIVAAAKPATAPLHPCFEWDNSKAGKAWREHQARNIVRAIVTVVDGEESIPTFTHVNVENVNYYQSTAVAVQNVDEWESAVETLAAKVRGARTALDDLSRVASQKSSPAHAVAVATIAQAFGMISETLEAMRH